ncbi:tryptophan--tRNA ligase [Halomicrobium sp. LC1Hm]|uniref:tryptophan--tRNA ligase n=1 Tax=Halomicrobium sp. LC1Hm TaxID=2610902 RepID=UPI00129831DE|nr:tryptophan--tRNA ligase [Halomicrobium sp. LC1Hm]QGA84192.1 Tryptophanyl-tRNA synthetase [Halomicrobium sp. LC1Hm]
MSDPDRTRDEGSPDDHSAASGSDWRERSGIPVRPDGGERIEDSRSSSELRSDGGEASEASRATSDLRSDGGTEVEGADDVALDPWGSSTVSDYRKLFDQFGIEAFDEVLPEVPAPHYLMRRGVIFGHRDYRPVARAMREGEPFAALSGFMPTGDPHIGHKLVFDEIIWHQEQGGDAYGLIADLEAHSARGLTWAEIDEHATNYVLSLLALGFDPEDGELYRQSENRDVQDLAFELGAEANFSELQAIYDFDGETDVSHMQSVVTQMADILYPQLDEPKPTVIPVGPDQDPHMRLARDLAARMGYFGVTRAYASFEADDAERELLGAAYEALQADRSADERVRCEAAADWIEAEITPDDVRQRTVEKLRAAGKEPLRPRTRFLDRNATDEAFEALIEAVEGEKRVYDEHVDAFDMDRETATALAREVALDHGGYGFRAPSSIYHRFMTGLTGGKMSSSIPASHISLLDDPEDGYDKVKSATTGGRSTAEEQREKGGKADECPVYELYAYLLAGDDDEFAKEVYDECVGGERLCGGCKEQAAELMESFLEDHQEKRAEWEAKLDELDIDLDSDRKR